jgi:nucleotide-binding universal stress UspA family protein
MSGLRLILLPTDGSPTADAAAHFAETIARAENSGVIVMTITEPAITAGIEDPDVTEVLAESKQDLAEREAFRLRTLGIPAEPLTVTSGSAHEAILRVAKERGVSLIVMGTHGRSALGRAILGSVADRVVRQATVPVVLVPLVREGSKKGMWRGPEAS